jgi:hypothetical protein
MVHLGLDQVVHQYLLYCECNHERLSFLQCIRAEV